MRTRLIIIVLGVSLGMGIRAINGLFAPAKKPAQNNEKAEAESREDVQRDSVEASKQ